MKNETELKRALNEAVNAALQAGDLIIEWSRQAAYEVRQKQGAELVTTADLRSDEIIREHLGSKFPQHRFFSEEVVAEENFDFSGPVWIIDPIDGTANYTHGHPYVSISVALTMDGDPCVGSGARAIFARNLCRYSGRRCDLQWVLTSGERGL